MRSKIRKKAASFTLRLDLYQWVEQQAKEERLNKSELIEIAVEKLKEANIKEELKASCLRMKDDVEIRALAKEGLEDFEDLIQGYEKSR